MKTQNSKSSSPFLIDLLEDAEGEGCADLHYDTFQLIYSLKEKKKLADYCVLFDSRVDDIASLSKEKFSKKLENHIAPLSQVAKNSGFVGQWTYR